MRPHGPVRRLKNNTVLSITPAVKSIYIFSVHVYTHLHALARAGPCELNDSPLSGWSVRKQSRHWEPVTRCCTFCTFFYCNGRPPVYANTAVGRYAATPGAGPLHCTRDHPRLLAARRLGRCQQRLPCALDLRRLEGPTYLVAAARGRLGRGAARSAASPAGGGRRGSARHRLGVR